jgi:uncharacterized protein YlxW (UPF0749 family)
MSNLERTSLEAHVDLCQLRYEQLDQRLTSLENKMNDIQKDIIDGHKSMKTTVITSAGSIIIALLGVIGTILMKF